MPLPTLEVTGTSIVCIGSFNPAILQPYWLAAQQLIRTEEAETAKTEIVHPDGTSIDIGSIKIQCTRDRFSVGTEDASAFEFARDIAMGYLKILSHTPIRAMGLNSHAHYKMESEEAWHQIGHKVAPKELWSNLLTKPGLHSLTMEGLRPDNFKGIIRVLIEPSERVRPGVYIAVNDHYLTEPSPPETGTEEYTQIITSNWKQLWNMSRKIAHNILGIKDE